MGKVVPPPIPRPQPIRLSKDWLISSVNTDGKEVNIKFKSSDMATWNSNSKRVSVASKMINGINEMVNAHIDHFINGTNSYSNASRNYSSENIENLFYMPTDLFEAVDFTDMGVIEEPQDFVPRFVKGEKYSLAGVSCEGFEMPEKIYELVGIHDEYDGININSVIVKQISGDQDKIFTLSKNDCACMGIEYENGLQLFPKHLNWRRVKEIVPFDKTNLGTTPVSDIDNTIRYVLIKLNGFKDYIDGYIVTPSGKLIKEEQFQKTLRIISDEPIVYEQPTADKQGVKLQENKRLDIELAYPKGLAFNHGNFISSEDTIYVLIKLAQPLSDPTLIDGKSGVERINLEGFNPNEHFKIAWDELGAYTIEEYEAEKARREKARQERIAKEEAAKKKKIAEEEERIRQQRANVEAAINKMKGYNIAMPKFPEFPKFDTDDGLSSLNLFTDGLDLYFNSLERQLSKLNGDLSSISKIIGVNLERRMAKDAMNKTIYDMFEL